MNQDLNDKKKLSTEDLGEVGPRQRGQQSPRGRSEHGVIYAQKVHRGWGRGLTAAIELRTEKRQS